MLRIVTVAVFLTVALMHAIRLGYQAPFYAGSIEISLWISFVAVIGTLLLAWFTWQSMPHRGLPELLRLLMVLFVIDITVLLYSWIGGFAYWGLSGSDFAWFILFDLLAIGIISNFIRKRA